MKNSARLPDLSLLPPPDCAAPSCLDHHGCLLSSLPVLGPARTALSLPHSRRRELLKTQVRSHTFTLLTTPQCFLSALMTQSYSSWGGGACDTAPATPGPHLTLAPPSGYAKQHGLPFLCASNGLSSFVSGSFPAIPFAWNVLPPVLGKPGSACYQGPAQKGVS